MRNKHGISKLVSMAGVIRSAIRPSIGSAASVVLLVLAGALASRVEPKRTHQVDRQGVGQQSVWEGRLQFRFCTPDDPRYVALVRSGWGGRRAEFSVFELVDDGRRLRRMHATSLENEVLPLLMWLMGAGRFLITCGELPGGLETDNSLVMYDFWTGRRIAKKLDAFLPERVISALRPHEAFLGKAWTRGYADWDRNSMVFVPNNPWSVREYDLPFLLVDLRDQTVTFESASDEQSELPASEGFPRRVVDWDWSVCGGNYPAPEEKFPYPPMIMGVVEMESASESFRAYIHATKVLYFRLDSATGDYVVTGAEDWVPRDGR